MADVLLPDELSVCDSDEEPILPDALVLDLCSESEVVPLPDDVIVSSCCGKTCVDLPVVQRAKTAWAAGKHNNGEVNIQLIQSILNGSTGRQDVTHRSYYDYFGQRVCRAAIKILWDCGDSKLDRYRDHVAQGNTAPPTDLRTCRDLREKQNKSQLADDFWLYMYRKLAEYLAEGADLLRGDKPSSTEVPLDVPGEHVAVASSSEQGPNSAKLEGQIGPMPGDPALVCKLAPKAAPPMTWEDVFCLFDGWCRKNVVISRCSTETIKRVWHAKWKPTLSFRHPTNHSVCARCTEIQMWRKRCEPDSREARACSDIYIEHIDDTNQDREVDTRIQNLATENFLASSPPAAISEDLLNGTVDGMEQAKFKLPRHPNNKSKDATALWKPQLHVTGVTMDGVQEYWYLYDCVLPKNASTQITLLADTLDFVDVACAERNRPMPKMYRMVSDNAAAETKNQTVMKYFAFLVFHEVFQVAELAQKTCGHTHDRQDGRFAVCANALNRNCHTEGGCMQDPEDVAKLIREKVRPLPRIRPHEVIILEGTWDWKDWLSELPLQVSGHVGTQKRKEENVTEPHVYRLVLRKNIEDSLFTELVSLPSDNITTDWPHLEPHDMDVVLLTKHFMKDVALSQDPCVFCPAIFMETLDLRNLKPARSVALSTRQAKELKQSKAFYEKAPWSLHRTSAYLQKLVDCDGSPVDAPPPLAFLRRCCGKEKIPKRPRNVIEFGHNSDSDDGVLAIGDSLNKLTEPSAGAVAVRRRLRGKHSTVGAGVSMLSAGAPIRSGDPLAPTGVFHAKPGGFAGRQQEKTIKRAAAKFDRSLLRPDEKLGCGVCRYVFYGCARCRPNAGFYIQDGWWVR